jgi:hypothetical protein
MARLKRKKGKLTAADLASYGILPKQPDESKPVKSQESKTPNGAAERSDSLLWESKANAEAYNTNTYPEVLKTFARMIDGTPKVQTFESVTSTFHNVAVAA